MESLRALALTALLVAAALPTGAALLRPLRFQPCDFPDALERYAVAVAAGLGVQGLLLTLFGLARVLYPAVVLAAPLLLALLVTPVWLPQWQLAVLRSADAAVGSPSANGPANPFRLATLAALSVLALLVSVQDLAPPTDYDGLLYHLVAPREFLAAHAIVYIPHNFSANLPAFGEMLYTFGLAAGSDRAPQLLHGVAGALSVALTYCLGRNTLGRSAAFWGSAALAATPLLPFLSTRAYIDLFTLLFSLLAVLAFVHWQRRGETRWLILAGAAAGWALATKYAAATLLVLLGFTVLVAAWRAADSRGTVTRLRHALLSGATLAAAAAATALPWYGRQVVALGNPVWPMYLGGRDWDAARVAQLTYFVEQYGTGRRMTDWLLLPLHVYTDSWRFGHVPDSYPPILALAAPLAFAGATAAVAWLWALAAGLLLLWARGWQDLRFLLPAYPLLALLGAAGVHALGARLRRPVQAQDALAGGVLLLAVWAALGELPRAADALPVIVGREGKDAYLARKLPDQRAIELLNEQMSPGAAALFLGDGQIWYCRQRCLPDAAHDNLLMFFVRPGSPEASLAALRREGISHVLLSRRDYWYLEHQDPQRRLQAQLAAFYAFKAQYLDLVYEDDLTELYRGRW